MSPWVSNSLGPAKRTAVSHPLSRLVFVSEAAAISAGGGSPSGERFESLNVGVLLVEEALERLELAAERLAEVENDELNRDLLNDYVTRAAKLRRRLEATEAALLSDWDETRAFRADSAPSAKKWLEYQAGYGPKEAGRKLCVARQLRTMPLTRAAFAAGDINHETVLKLSSVNVDRTADAFLRDETKLLNWAKNLSHERLIKKLDNWQKHVDPDGPDPRPGKRFGKIDRRDDGMYHLDVLFDHVVGSEAHTAVVDELDRLYRQDWQAAKDRLGKVPTDHDLHRTHQQRMSDAVANLIRRGAANPTQLRRPLLNILIGSNKLANICELFNGSVLTPAEVAELLRQGITTGLDSQRIIFNEVTNDLAAEKPRRFFRGLTRRVVEIRDRTCQGEMCHVSADRCDIDHVEPWPAGETSVHNGQCLCRSCHSLKTAADQRRAREKRSQHRHERNTYRSPTQRPDPPMRS